MARPREFDKDKVIEQAMMLFWAQGYEATSVRDLQKATGISSSSMYEVFGDKRNIFLVALARFCELERARIMQMASDIPSPQMFIEELFASLEVLAQPNSRAQGSMAFNAMVEFGTLDADVTRLLLEHYYGIGEIIARVIAQGQSTGAIASQEDATNLAYTILTTIQGVAIIKGAQPDFAYGLTISRIVLKLLDS
jgi:TetR/AcrR family transcriptional regulator, transcriptional repressor for nem operon